MKHLVLGGARSGKSRFAEQLALRLKQQYLNQGYSSVSLHYIATATADDDEMQQRIAHHKAERSKDWFVYETPLDLAETLLCISQAALKPCTPHNRQMPRASHAKSNEVSIVVVDCLTLWLNNLLQEDQVEQQIEALVNGLPNCNSQLIMVSNEVGSGIVPLGQLSRDFVDYAGRLHQTLAKMCDDVSLIVAGLPLVLKSSGNNIS